MRSKGNVEIQETQVPRKSEDPRDPSDPSCKVVITLNIQNANAHFKITVTG